jgi:hypothetical protein
MVMMKMTKDAKASECGIKIDSYIKDETYDLSEKTAAAFLRMNVAKMVKTSTGSNMEPVETTSENELSDTEDDDQDADQNNDAEETPKERKARLKAEKLALKNQGGEQ